MRLDILLLKQFQIDTIMYLMYLGVFVLLIRFVAVFGLYDIKKLFLFDNFISSIVNSTGNLYIDVYFKALLLFSFFNLLFSIFGMANFIHLNGDMSLMYVFTIVHTIACLVYGAYTIGPKKIFLNFYIIKGKGYISRLVGFFIFFLLVFIDFIVKPLVIATRLLLNVFVGESLHSALIGMKGGVYFIVFLNCFKLVMYILQAYLFYIFMFSIYQHACIFHKDVID